MRDAGVKPLDDGADGNDDAAVREKILRRLAAKGELKAGAINFKPLAERKAVLERLQTEGLISAGKQGRAVTYSLTELGRQRAAALPPESPPAPRPRAGGGAELSARLERIEAAIGRIEALLRPAPAGALKPLLLEVIAELDSARRYGGLVPLPDIRQALRGRGVTAPDGDVNAALEELEREYAIDLSIAQSPTTVPDRAAGIERPGRGLVYYVVRRHN